MTFDLETALQLWLAEDLGPQGVEAFQGDITTRATVDPDQRCRAWITAGQEGILAGTQVIKQLTERYGSAILDFKSQEGATLVKGNLVLEWEDLARTVLTLERLVLDLLAHLSGIATATAEVVEAVKQVNPKMEVAATRKTTPGLRVLEKAAVVAGGGVPHRVGLYDAFLVKDNHLSLQGRGKGEPVVQAIQACRDLEPQKLLEVEADTPEQALAAAREGVDWLLLDNFTPTGLAELVPALRQEFPDVKLELSGGITPSNVADYAPWGDRVSLGWLTQSAPALPMSLHVEPL